jgi:hypothetical protein
MFLEKHWMGFSLTLSIIWMFKAMQFGLWRNRHDFNAIGAFIEREMTMLCQLSITRLLP